VGGRTTEGRAARAGGHRAASALSTLRSLVGAGTWASPAASWRTFGFGSTDVGASTVLLGRLFGVRDLALGRAVRHESADVRRAALRAGVLCDSADVVATVLALRRGAPRASGVLVGGGAALFATLGVLALAAERSTGRPA
jgi:hypothetical protein